jgi:hypothetical protein
MMQSIIDRQFIQHRAAYIMYLTLFCRQCYYNYYTGRSTELMFILVKFTGSQVFLELLPRPQVMLHKR